jgi:predicted esterase
MVQRWHCIVGMLNNELLSLIVLRLSYPQSLGGIVTASGYGLFNGKYPISEANKGTNVLCLQGEADSVVRHSIEKIYVDLYQVDMKTANQSYENLQQQGASFDFNVEKEAGHTMTDTHREQLASFFGTYYL